MRREIVCQMRVVERDFFPQRAHRRQWIALADLWTVLLQEIVQCALGQLDHRRDRPQRVIEVERQRADHGLSGRSVKAKR